MDQSRRCLLDGLYKGAWTSNEDKILTDYVKVHGEGKWNNVAKKTDLKRSGVSCRLRWKNYLTPDIKRGNISHDEEELIIRLHKLLGNRWSLIAGRLPGRTDNEIKNYWKTTLAKRAKDLKMKVFTPIGNVNEVPRTMCKANVKLTSQAVLVDTAVQSDKNHYGTNNISIGPSTENYMSRKMEYEFNHALPSSLPQLKDHANATDFLMNDDKVFGRGIVRMNDDKVSPNGGGGGGGYHGDGDSSFLKKLAEGDRESSLDFQSLASSFLESAEEWPPIYLNISAFNQEK